MEDRMMYRTNELLEWSGNYYGTFTIFKIKESYINTHIEYNQKIWPYAKLRDIILDKDRNVFKYRFVPHGCKHPISLSYQGYFDVEPSQINAAIESLYAGKPMPKELVYVPRPKSDFEVQGMGTLWAIYIVVLIASLIFKDFIGIWAIATYAFYKIRKEMKKP